MAPVSDSSWIDATCAVIPDAQGRLHIRAAALELRAGRIIRVLDTLPDALPEGADVTRLDSRSLLTPSWVNAHTHLPMACFRALDIEQSTHANVVEQLFFRLETAMDDQDIAAFARVGAYESLIHGVGLVWEHYYGGQALAEAIAQTGLAAVVAPTLQDLDGPGKDHAQAQLEATLAIAQSETLREQGIWAALGPHATDTVSDALWAQVGQLAQAHKLPIHVHVAQSIEEYERAITTRGCSPVGVLKRAGVLDDAPHVALIHGIYISKADLAMLDPARHTLGFCPYSQLIFNFPARVSAWSEAKLPWFVATDCAASNDAMNVQKELRFVAGQAIAETTSSQELFDFLDSPAPSLERAQEVHAHRQARYAQRQAQATPERLLPLAWSIPGRMHPDFSAGVIAPDAVANLAVWDLEHPSFWPGSLPLRTLALGECSGALKQLMVCGRWINEPQALPHTPEYREAVQIANDRLKHLKRRAGL